MLKDVIFFGKTFFFWKKMFFFGIYQKSIVNVIDNNHMQVAFFMNPVYYRSEIKMNDATTHRHAKSQEPGNLVPGHFWSKIRTFFRYQRLKEIHLKLCSGYVKTRFK